MRSNCRCGYDADPSVFGACRDCSPKPPPDAAVPWPFERRIEQAAVPAQYLGDPDGWTELRPFEQTLSDGDGDLG